VTNQIIINGFEVTTTLQNDVKVSKDDGLIDFKPNEGATIGRILSSGARMQNLKKRPPKITNLPFSLSFNKDDTLTLSRTDRDGSVTMGWGEIDGAIVAFREAVNILNNDITHRPAPGKGRIVSFGPGDPFV